LWLPLPPNRTCGSPASGSPVGGSPHQGLMRVHGRQREHSMHLCYEHQHSSGSERRVNRGRSSSLSLIRHSRLVAPPSFCATLIHLPAVPSLHSRYKSFMATTAALTPVCSGSSGLPSMNSGSVNKQVSLIHSSRLPDHSVSTHHDAPLSPLYHATPQLDSFPFPV
jgi:hypothetical protein